MIHNKIPKLHNLLWVGILGIVSACSTQYPVPAPTQAPDTIQKPIGANQPTGYTQTKDNARYTVVGYQQLPQWSRNDFSGSLKAFLQGCEKLTTQTQWHKVCQKARTLYPNDQAAIKSFFEQHFTAWQISEQNNPSGLFTGYYEAVLGGSLNYTPQARFPIYGIPKDFISVPITPEQRKLGGTVKISLAGNHQGVLDDNGAYFAEISQFPMSERSNALKGRIVGKQLVPYYTRNQINGGALNNGLAPILAYASDPVELFFLHVQGSGRLRLNNGQYVRLAYADKNDYPYVSIGKYMVEKGYLPQNDVSAQRIQQYLYEHPNQLAEILGQNPSYVFFKPSILRDEDGPVGALGVPLTAGFSVAVDKQYIDLGTPVFVSTTHPKTNQPINRLMMAQDTGTAIKGAVRVDYFWGYGYEAGQTAGKMKHQGLVWLLLPNGVNP